MAMKKDIPSLKKEYINNITGKHGELSHYPVKGSEAEIYRIFYPLFWDTVLRDCIGKTDDINVSLCSHDAIISRELPEHFCRVCHKNLAKAGIGRVNDYLVLRHPQCRQPICLDCAKNRPDAFYKAFEQGVERYKAVSAAGRIVSELKEMTSLIEKQQKR